MDSPQHSRAKPKLALSACLLGAKLGYHDGHADTRLRSQTLADYFELIPLSAESAADEQLAAELSDICGYIYTQQTPSAGPDLDNDRASHAQSLAAHYPQLPVEEHERLDDPILRESFITRVFAYAHWRQLLQRGLSRKALSDFHSGYKYLLMATHPQHYKRLGQLLGQLDRNELEPLAGHYFSELMSALRSRPSPGTHANALQHISGYFKQGLSGAERQALQQLIKQYRQGLVPLAAPMTRLQHHLRDHPDAYLARQVYLQPLPENPGLRQA
jgi:uncharacterized protein YbgA (DUF1722 family)